VSGAKRLGWLLNAVWKRGGLRFPFVSSTVEQWSAISQAPLLEISYSQKR